MPQTVDIDGDGGYNVYGITTANQDWLARDTIMPVWCVMPDIDGLRADFLTMMSDDDLQKCLPETVVELRPSLGSQAEVAIRA